ncbi:hypothetical protein [Glycomyces sp. MUSA5-2]|uniref:hypothetical protein n=1 Tax=Glycomyces sp. MUSA5-2 TaxID=2053002 RepID=UPI00300A3947
MVTTEASRARQVLADFIASRRPPTPAGQWRLARLLHRFGKADPALAVLTRADMHGAVLDLLTGESDPETIRTWAREVTILFRPFEVTGHPITAEDGYHWSVHMVVNSLASDPGQSWLGMDVEGLGLMLESLALDDPDRYEGEAYRAQLRRHLDTSYPRWAQPDAPSPPDPQPA